MYAGKDPLSGRELRFRKSRKTEVETQIELGKPFTEHRHIPDLRPDPADARGDALPSVPELARLQGLKPGTLRHAFLVLKAEGLLVIRHGRTTQVAGDRPESSDPATRYRSARARLSRAFVGG